MHLQLLGLQALHTLHFKELLDIGSVRPDLVQQCFTLQKGSHNIVWQLAMWRVVLLVRSGAVAAHQTGEAERYVYAQQELLPN